MIKFLESLSTRSIYILSFVQIAVLAVIDFLTGYEISFSFFYLIPVAFTAWVGSQKMNAAVAVISAAIWQLANYEAGQVYSHVAIGYWNSGTRLGFFIVVGSLLIQLKKSLNNEKQLSRIDHLTGAANLRQFKETAQIELARARRYKRDFSIAYFDVDNFKMVNDTLGHPVGDELLIKIVATIKGVLRGTDLIGRVGGDEFVIFLPETNADQVPAVIAKIRSKLKFAMEEKLWPVTFSMGVLSCTVKDHTIEDILRQVDALMYNVKKGGKNSVQYEILGEDKEPAEKVG